MLTVKYLLERGEKVGLTQLSKILAAGLEECQTEAEKKEFGLQALKIYDYENDDEMHPYLKHGIDTKYYSNLIERNDSTLLKNIVWNPQAETPVHGHNCQGCWVLCLQGQLTEEVMSGKEGEPSTFKTLTPGAVTYMHDSIGFHRISNETPSTPAVTLHCYHPPYDETSVLKETGEISVMP